MNHTGSARRQAGKTYRISRPIGQGRGDSTAAAYDQIPTRCCSRRGKGTGQRTTSNGIQHQSRGLRCRSSTGSLNRTRQIGTITTAIIGFDTVIIRGPSSQARNRIAHASSRRKRRATNRRGISSISVHFQSIVNRSCRAPCNRGGPTYRKTSSRYRRVHGCRRCCGASSGILNQRIAGQVKRRPSTAVVVREDIIIIFSIAR